jgi:hypothetical protein
MVTEIELFQPTKLIPLDFCLCIWMQRELYNVKVIKRHKFPAGIVYAAARTEKREDKIRRKRSDLRTGAAKCSEVGGGIFEYLLKTATNF